LLGDFGRVERDRPENVTVVATRSAFERVLVTEEYTETGVIDLSFVAGGEPAGGYEHFSVSVLNRGALVPLDALEAEADDAGRFRATVGDGRYVVLAGVRDAAGNPSVTMRDVVVGPGARRVIAFDVTPEAGDLRLDPEEARSLGEVIEAVVLFDLGNEPDVRMLPLIAGALSPRSANVAATYVSVGSSEEETAPIEELLPPGASTVRLGGGEPSYVTQRGAVIDVPASGGSPVVALFESESGTEILTVSGYDLNIDRRLSDAIDGHLTELTQR
jgi:hypothetical protein